MAQLAIKGHASRGKEVIEILEMLGGKNSYRLNGYEDCAGFVIDKDGNIGRLMYVFDDEYVRLTLEEFLEKYPHKVGDKVIFTKYGDNDVVTVESMNWTGTTIEYNYNCGASCLAKDLQPYKEETMEEKGTLVQIDLTRELCIANEVEIILGDYEFVLKDGKTYFVKKEPQYPKTYEECCEVLFPSSIELGKVLTSGYNCEKLKKFGELLICRDAYWKIAGEQMGLGKPWSPSDNDEGTTYSLCYNRNRDCFEKFSGIFECNSILDFPTKEMRDEFAESDIFKDLMEICKEFL